jgi:hypothetical protein
VVAVDVRAERLGLLRLAHPEDGARVDEVLHQSVDGEQEAEDDDEPRDQLQPFRAVHEGERRGEVDQQPRELDERRARCLRVEGERARRLCPGLGRAEGEELD